MTVDPLGKLLDRSIELDQSVLHFGLYSRGFDKGGPKGVLESRTPCPKSGPWGVKSFPPLMRLHYVV